ncbi:MAG: LytR/AlgR family response regulator transcription factor [Flammeovirgaceae bacterium]
MKVLIIEDEAPAFRRLQQLIQEIDSSIEIVEVIDSVQEAVKWMKTYSMPDLIFMDIQLADGLSFEIFEKISVTKPVIFTTAYDEYTLKAFKVNSIDYLLKPLNKRELAQSIQKFEAMKEAFSGGQAQRFEELLSAFKQDAQAASYKSRFLIKASDRLISILTQDIAYFYTDNGLVYLQTNAGKRYLMDYTLDELEKQLDPQFFFRLNRQFITQHAAILEIHNYFKGKLLVKLQPVNSHEVVVSREKASVFKRWLDS